MTKHKPDCSCGVSPVTRRRFLWEAGAGVGGLALAWLLKQDAYAGPKDAVAPSPYAAKPTHFAPKAKRVLHICALGGVSHIDSFDFKPDLIKHDGQELTSKGKLDPFFGKPGRLMKCPFEFKQHGQCGQWVSALFPHLAKCVDDMTFIQSMTAKSSAHTPATFQINTGFTMNGFPSVGAWVSYGLGSENQDLPAFVVLPDPRQVPAGGPINWTSGFLPAVHQGVALRTSGEPIADLNTPADTAAPRRQADLQLLNELNRDFRDANAGDSALAARLRAYELAARMQLSVPEAVGLENESEATKKMYGLDVPEAEGFGRNCLRARRLLERGVRFVQLFHGGNFGLPRINWDGHENVIENHRTQALTMDQPVAGLLQDLKQRGMLKDTLVVWTTEFGRTPYTEGIGTTGRDHHQHCFTIWLAGAGLKPGFKFGTSDEVGFHPAEHPLKVYDLHATILHLLGMDHERLTYYHNGIQRRLTDVHGHVIKELLA